MAFLMQDIAREGRDRGEAWGRAVPDVILQWDVVFLCFFLFSKKKEKRRVYTSTIGGA
jgi:hypothetical protein